jgi:hypothetical protein
MSIEEIKNTLEEILNQYSDVRDEETLITMLEGLEHLTTELDAVNHFDEIEYQKVSDDLDNLRGLLNDAIADFYVEEESYDDYDDDEY